MNSSYLVIVPSGKKKIWDKHPDAGSCSAKRAYGSTLNKKGRAFAEANGYDWVILSGKAGLLLPDDVVLGNYDVSFGTNDPDLISLPALYEQTVEKDLQTYEEIVVLGGKKFIPVMDYLFKRQNVAFPLNGCRGIGEMLQLLDKWTFEAAKMNKSTD
ncbi:DUF6884 domain-containing protein [Paenibacillus lutrae]|uniref:DUF6884 domain-containing protein n=1 Tax=Paenibacillus lutrae TaxID=2078573 RepID=A0A7X3FIB6_9BACL|nr:DUF6884 domain-containing protein [Paenibacillus lutrae]MVP00138.1 hypothetical protein [Paenibacillus lutrae]